VLLVCKNLFIFYYLYIIIYKILKMTSKQYINLFVNSENGSNRSTDNSSFTQRFQNALKILKDAKNCVMYLHSADIWYTFKNISSAKQNNKIYYSKDTNDVFESSITFDDGLYSLDMINAEIKRQLIANNDSDELFYFEASDHDGRVILRIGVLSYIVYFDTDSPCDLLGVVAESQYPDDINDYAIKFPNTAQFSEVSNILFHTSLTGGLHIDGRASSVLSSIPINCVPFDLIQYHPYNQIKINADNIVNTVISDIRVWITNQNDVLLDTNNEYYSALIIIEYNI